MRRERIEPPAGVTLEQLAERVAYVGSVEHKRYPSFAGRPRPRADATLCNPSFKDADQLTEWVRKGLKSGQIGAPWEGDFPRYVWLRVEDAWYEARLVNQTLGQYKGYELGEADDLPDWMTS
jgi:hypothetical protein